MARRLVLVTLVVSVLSSAYGAGIEPRALDRDALVRARYSALLTLSLMQRKQLVVALPNDVRSSLWTFQISELLRDGTDMTAEQRAVAYEGIGLLAAGKTPTEAAADFNAFEKRLRSAFATSAHAVAFVQLGTDTMVPATPADRATLTRLRSVARRPDPSASLPQCSCSHLSDWCDTFTNPDNVCSSHFSCTRTIDGCGTFWDWECDGICWSGPL
jgi:hypothetical protein